MGSNLRSKSIQGYITDSAGNILRNAQIVIKTSNPTTGSVIVDSIKSDDNGYFISSPLPDGTYDIYESGIRITRTYHIVDKSKIQCYKPNEENYITTLTSFTGLLNIEKLNNFKCFLQIEPEFIDIFQFGNIFPIYDVDISGIVDSENELLNIAKFFNFSEDSRITTTRFDIEYFAPLTSVSSQYKRIRWAGVPGIRFKKDSRILVPIDYFSLVPSLPKFYIGSTQSADIEFDPITSQDIVIITGSSDIYNEMTAKISIGDILELRLVDSDKWFGIVLGTDGSNIILERWRSSRYLSSTINNPPQIIEKVLLYDGIFQNIFDIDDSNNERFTVAENIYAQDGNSELYNYYYRYQLV
jgi:hypothetical protein